MAEIFNFNVQDNRSIQFPKANLLEPIMQEDHNVAVWRFRIPKVLNQIDMSGWAWWFVYVNAKNETYSESLTLVDDVDEPDTYCTADYSIDYGISKFPGAFSFSLEAISAEQGGEIDGEWHTKTYTHKVDKTLQGNQAQFAETESDIISALITEFQIKIRQLVGGATPLVANLKSQMTDHDAVYLYTGSEDGESNGYWYYYNGTNFVPGGVYASGIAVDSVPTQGSNNAVSSGGVYSALEEIDTEIDAISGNVTSIVAGGKLLSSGVKTALLNILSHVAYIDGNAQTYIDALTDAWTVEAVLTGITATFTQGSAEITDRDALDDLKPYLQVKGTYSVSGATFEEEITDYTLSGTLTEGQSTITVTVGTFTTTFTVTVTEWSEYDIYTKIIATGAEYIATDFSETAFDGYSYEYKAAPAANEVIGSGHIFSSKNTYVAFPQTQGSSYNRVILTHINAGNDKRYGSAETPAWNNGVDMVIQSFVGDTNSVLLDGTTIIATVTPGATIESEQNYVIFGYGGRAGSASYRFRGALYYLKIFDTEGNLIHHFVPAKSNITNIAGLYDQISEVFYTSATATAFTVE